ncbi:OPT oligopeptide transporter [Zalerion maritima]|uniref:OPT oligopeptide transporter n=1 Tax=Zalerion maritima TaxID=339359 RepID=A0AAD5WXZ4_9PEZI|nr:OPT oligopeptide transporter [Zalerion maritima]
MSKHERRATSSGSSADEKGSQHHVDVRAEPELGVDLNAAKEHLKATEIDLEDARRWAEETSLEDLYKILESVRRIHKTDPNFPHPVLKSIEFFLDDEDIREHPEAHVQRINEMKLETALITNNSPYAEVRAVVENTDNVEAPQLTFRVLSMGILFTAIKAAVYQLFIIRLPQVEIDVIVFQVLAYPIGKLLEKILPDAGFTFRDTRYTLNPGKWSFKEHMLVVIMVGACSAPYTDYIIFVQVLPQFFNQPWANSLTYQMTIAMSVQFIGYSIAGLCRPFLVFPSYCLWPNNLATLAVNKAFHSDANEQVAGPWKRLYSISRFRLFLWLTLALFIWEWFPQYIFTGLGTFSWMEWIAPSNIYVKAFTGMDYGIGWNPLSTFDWANVTYTIKPLVYPFFTSMNTFIGMTVSSLIVLIFWMNNAFHTGYLPAVSPTTFDHFGKSYNVSKILDDRAQFDLEKYRSYSPAYMAASHVQLYMFFFAEYTCVLTHTILCHGHQLKLAFKALWHSLPFVGSSDSESDAYQDVHNRLMRQYPEAHAWWYLACLAISIALGLWGILSYPTETPPWVVFFGIFMSIIFLVPCGIAGAITGMAPTLNVMAEFIGGLIVPGNALAMNFFKTYGYITTAYALNFAGDMKLAHYVKESPRNLFIVQMIGTFVTTIVNVFVVRFQLELPNVCDPDPAIAPMRMVCPGPRVFFTASVFWGSLGPKRVWGPGGQYSVTLVGFLIGILFAVATWAVQKKWRNKSWPRQLHPVAFTMGFTQWHVSGMGYLIPAMPFAYYNYIVHAGFTLGTALTAIVVFFALAMQGIDLSWWGNEITATGLGSDYSQLTLKEGEYFGPRIGDF